MNSIKNKAIFIQALLGGVLITVLLLPFQAMTPYAPYTWMIFVPIVILFALGPNPKIIPAMFLSYVCGILWGQLFFLLADKMMAFMPMEGIFAILTTVIIFLILLVHPMFLGKTPFALVPCVIIGFVESLFTFLIKPSNVEPVGAMQLLFFFGYGVVLGGILLICSKLLCDKFLGKDWVKEM